MTSSWGPMTCLKRASVYCITVSLVRSGGTAEGWRSLEMCLQSGAALRLLTHQDTAAYTHTQTKQCFRSVAELRVMTSTPIYVHCSSLYIYIKFLKQQSHSWNLQKLKAILLQLLNFSTYISQLHELIKFFYWQLKQ